MNSAQPPSSREAPADEIYVGYLPVPRGYARFLRLVVPALVAVVVAAAALAPLAGRSPGPAVWDTDTLVEVEGVAIEQPYAILRILDNETPGGVRAVPLVQEGKRGGREIVAGMSGHRVRLRGYWLARDGRRLLEVVEPATRVDGALPPSLAAAPLPARREAAVLSGEIIDPKCYFGAMKPGEGKTHKACATLCVKGGIPPMLATRDAAGAPRYVLLADPAGGPANEFVLPYVGDRVTLRGVLGAIDDFPVLTIAADGIRRD